MADNIYEIDGMVTGTLTALNQQLTGTIIPVGGDLTTYAGPYDATPKVTPQLLNTNGKIMRDDVTVWGIPYTEVTNPKGTTVIIGND